MKSKKNNSAIKTSYSVRRDMFIRVTNILIVCNIVAFFCSLFINRFSTLHVPACLIVSTLICSFLRYLANFAKNYRVMSLSFAAYVELFVLPVFILVGADVAICTPMWFLGCLIIMMFILEKRDFWWVFIFVMYWNSFLYTRSAVFGGFHTSTIDKYAYFHGYILSFAMISIALYIILHKIEKNYTKAESEIDKSREIEKEAQLAKTRFMANMSHEIRTPMNSIIGLSELILKDDMDDVTRNEVNIVRKSSYDLLGIIDDVLMYSKLDAKKVRITNVEFKFDELLEQVLTNISLNLEKKDVKVRVQIDHDIPKVVLGDDIRIKQVFMSLAFISLALTENGRLMISVKCERDETDSTARFICKISDTGCGLSQYDLDAIYGAYDTYDSRQNSNLKGIGLKFTICKEIMNLLGGTMDIRSIQGVGLESEFSFTLKIVNSEPMINVENGETKSALIYTNDNREYNAWKSIMEGFKIRAFYVNSYFSFDRAIRNKKYDFIFVPDNVYPTVANVINAFSVEESTYITTGADKSYGDFDKCRIVRHPISSLSLANVLNDMWKEEDYTLKIEDIKIDAGRAKVLVVDDNAVNLKVAQGIFLNYNIVIDTAKSGQEALDKLQNKAYDMIFMDMVMPELSGEETLIRIRKLNINNSKEVPIVALTANTGGNIKQEILDKGFQEYIAKPIKQRYLSQCLVKLLPPDVFTSGIKAYLPKKGTEAKKRDLRRTDILVDFDKGKANLGNDVEVYKNVLDTFVKESLEKSQKLSGMLSDNDLTLFTTTVHGIKSSLASIGAEAASKHFLELEKAGKEGNTDYISAYLSKAQKKLSDVIGCVNDYLGVKQQVLFATEESKLDSRMVEKLKEAIDYFDISYIRSFIEEALYIPDGTSTKKKVLEMQEALRMYDFKRLSTLSDSL